MTEEELSDWLSTYCEFTVDEYGATGYKVPYDKLGPLVDFINGRTNAKEKSKTGQTRATNGEEAASESCGWH